MDTLQGLYGLSTAHLLWHLIAFSVFWPVYKLCHVSVGLLGISFYAGQVGTWASIGAHVLIFCFAYFLYWTCLICPRQDYTIPDTDKIMSPAAFFFKPSYPAGMIPLIVPLRITALCNVGRIPIGIASCVGLVGVLGWPWWAGLLLALHGIKIANRPYSALVADWAAFASIKYNLPYPSYDMNEWAVFTIGKRE